MAELSVTEEDCKEILRKFSPTAKLLTFTIKSLAEEVEGYLSSHFNLNITYQENNKEKNENFFMKKLNEDSGFLTEFAKNLEVFTKEIFFYKFYSNLEQLKNFTPFAPKCYLCKEDLIVIENLTNTNFYVKEANVLYNLEEAKMALKTLALYHASFIACEEKKSNEHSKYRLNLQYPKEFEDVTSSMDKNGAIYRYFETSNKVILNLSGAVLNNVDQDEFKKMIIDENNITNMEYIKKYRHCVLHCDLWTKNIMFRKTDDKITDCRLIDFQLLRYFPPGYDIGLFFSANTSLEFRKKHKSELIQYYYDCLDKTFKGFGVDCSDVIPFQDFLDGVILCEPSAKMFAFNDTIVLILASVKTEALQNPELLEEYLIEKRAQFALEHYGESDEFKKWVDDELKELYDALVLKKKFLNQNSVKL